MCEFLFLFIFFRFCVGLRCCLVDAVLLRQRCGLTIDVCSVLFVRLNYYYALNMNNFKNITIFILLVLMHDYLYTQYVLRCTAYYLYIFSSDCAFRLHIIIGYHLPFIFHLIPIFTVIVPLNRHLSAYMDNYYLWNWVLWMRHVMCSPQ